MRGGNHLPKYLSDQINTVDLNMIDGACRGAFLDGATWLLKSETTHTSNSSSLLHLTLIRQPRVQTQLAYASRGRRYTHDRFVCTSRGDIRSSGCNLIGMVTARQPRSRKSGSGIPVWLFVIWERLDQWELEPRWNMIANLAGKNLRETARHGACVCGNEALMFDLASVLY